MSEREVSGLLQGEIALRMEALETAVVKRSAVAGECLRRSALQVLSGARSGKVYGLGDGKVYRASRAGEAPAERTGAFRQSWAVGATELRREGTVRSVRVRLESGLTVGGHLLGDLLEEGTERMAARPYKEAVVQGARASLAGVYGKGY